MTYEQIGSLLASHRLLTEDQAEMLDVSTDAETDEMPLESVSKRLGLDTVALLDALAQATLENATRVNLSQTAHDPAALTHLDRHDAWDYLVLPLSFADDGTLVCATTEETLTTALALLLRKLSVPFHLVITSVTPLEQYIAEQYHYEGIDAA